jgi:hypothetical protein
MREIMKMRMESRQQMEGLAAPFTYIKYRDSDRACDSLMVNLYFVDSNT